MQASLIFLSLSAAHVPLTKL